MLSTGYALYFENAAVRVLEHPSGFAIFQYQPGPRALLDLQAALTHLGNLLRQRAWHTVLSDQRRMQPFAKEETAWMAEFWAAYLARQDGGLRAAVLVAHDVFARLASSEFRHSNQQATLNITYRTFEEEPDVLAWLTQPD